MCNANDQVMTLVQSYLDTKSFIDELQVTLDSISDQIKQFMVENNADEMPSMAAAVISMFAVML